MCGRFTVRTAPRVRLKGVNNPDLPFAARYNIAPTQDVLVVADFGDGPVLTKLVWGLIPARSTDGKRFINVRTETIEIKASFSESFRKRRCLILADGFFEWKRSARSKQAYYFQMTDGSQFAFAGIWDSWGNEQIKSCAIITTTANETLAPIHDRMPVILRPESYGLWLGSPANAISLRKLLVPYSASTLLSHPVSSAVNSPQNDRPELIDREDWEIGTTQSLF